MNTALDASALLALRFAEPGAETVADASGAATSAVNLSEVATVLVPHQRLISWTSTFRPSSA